jgi:hypothetical protein
MTMCRSHHDTLRAWLVPRRETAGGCSNHENCVRVALGHALCEVVKQIAATVVGMLDVCSSVAKLLNSRSRASQASSKNNGKSRVGIDRVNHRMQRGICCGAIAANSQDKRGHRSSWVAAAASALHCERRLAVVRRSVAAVFLPQSFDDLGKRVFAGGGRM